MQSLISFPRADIDRLVIRRGDDPPNPARLSITRTSPRYVLLGEPGSGKSTAFLAEAEAAGTEVVTARAFVGGARPDGRSVFIDALEEFRIGEAGMDRLESLIDALKSSGYQNWRIACRAISLLRPDAYRLEAALGSFDTLQLEPLEPAQQRKILEVVGELDPSAFIASVDAMGAALLLGNPSTLLLLRDTLQQATTPIRTRGALLAEATRQMAHEVNPLMPERADRPPATNIEAAAEVACLVLLLSTRNDMWMLSTRPTSHDVVTRDDLLPARIDTQALRAALDTAMFTGDGETFMPAHRFVAEYLGGRALARTTAPANPDQPALSLNRAIAFLQGDDDHPAPALTGIYAWFVTTLANTVHAQRALELIRGNPEAVLFHGDAAMLPTEHRRVLLAAVGRDDPWFLAGYRGSTALSGLAGDDLAADMRAILEDPAETSHRRALVMMALEQGQPLPALAPALHSIFVDEDKFDHFDRRYALNAIVNVEGRTPETYRTLLKAIEHQAAPASIALKIEILAALVPGANAAEVRAIIEAYGRTGDGVIGYARPLANKLVHSPMPELFDQPIEAKRHTGEARYHEAASVIDDALAAAISSTADLSADRLLDWLQNVGLEELSEPEKEVRESVALWLEAATGRDVELFAAIASRTPAAERWRIVIDYERLAGRAAPEVTRTSAIEQVESAQDEGAVREAADLAFRLLRPFQDHAELYWRLWHALEGKPGGEQVFAILSSCEVDDWQIRSATQKRDRAVEREAQREEDRQWYRDHLEEVRVGATGGHAYAAQVYLGHRRGEGEAGPERLTDWVGDADIVAAIKSGWQVLAHEPGPSAFEAGRRTVGTTVYNIDLIALAWADASLREGRELDAEPATLLRIAASAYALPDERQEIVRKAALARIYDNPHGADALLSFWKGGIVGGGRDLPLGYHLDAESAAVKVALEKLLVLRPVLREPILHSALVLAARTLPQALLKVIADAALSRPLPDFAQRLWRFVAWMIDPGARPDIFDCEFKGHSGHGAFADLASSRLGALGEGGSEATVVRFDKIISSLGATCVPGDRLTAVRSDPASLTANAIEGLSRLPTKSAEATLERLSGQPALSPWADQLQHALAQQRALRRETEFRPPLPSAVAAALAAGPPATAGDLRAIIKESLDELATDIRYGDTSPWKGFWNRPTRTKDEPDPRNTPKIENDCRDLLTDRLADRLRRYGIPVRHVQTEDRTGDDRRADAMIVLGSGAAAVPIEAKRHWNNEIWTAVEDQLVPYCTTAGSNGHGIYLVFWFGSHRETPARPDGMPRPRSADELRRALIEQLHHERAGKIEIVVVDVSEPSADPTRKPPPA